MPQHEELEVIQIQVAPTPNESAKQSPEPEVEEGENHAADPPGPSRSDAIRLLAPFTREPEADSHIEVGRQSELVGIDGFYVEGWSLDRRVGAMMARMSEPESGPASDDEPVVEPRGERLSRHARRTRLYAWAFLLVALLVVVIVLVAKNTRSVKLDWAVGSFNASLVWIILAAVVFGWLLGIATGVIFRYRTRRRV